MDTYGQLKQELINEHAQILKIKAEIDILTTTLIGAIGKGHAVKVINYNKDKLKEINLDSYIQIFEKANKSVEDLEYSLYQKHELFQKLIQHFKVKNSNFKKEYLISPNQFLNQYFVINKETVIDMQNKNTFALFNQKALDTKILYNYVSVNNFLHVFFKDEEDLYKIKKIFSDMNVSLDYSVSKLELSEEYEPFLAYLYIGKNKKNKD